MRKSELKNYPREIEIETAEAWIKSGTIQMETTGWENTYYLDQFGNEFFCKNYPETHGDCGLPHSWNN